MKALRVLLVAVLGLTLAGVAAFAWSDTKTSTINIPQKFSASGGSDLNFPDVPGGDNDADDPGAIGTYYSNKVEYTINCNADLEVTHSCTQFSDGAGHSLPTSYRYKWFVGGAWQDWKEKTAPCTIMFDLPHSTHGGTIKFKVQLDVTRNGYADHYGLYMATFSITMVYI